MRYQQHEHNSVRCHEITLLWTACKNAITGKVQTNSRNWCICEKIEFQKVSSKPTIYKIKRNETKTLGKINNQKLKGKEDLDWSFQILKNYK